MSGNSASWTPERRAAQAKAIKARWAAGAFAKRPSPTERQRETARARMKLLNIRMRDDEALKAKCIRGQKRARRSPAARQIQAAVMRETHERRPELRRQAKFRCIAMNRNPKMRKRQWAGRRRKRRQST